MTNTKEIIKEVGRDVGTGLARAGKITAKGLAQIVCKASYPVLGNLSWNMQKRLQNAVGDRYYNAEKAFKVSCWANEIAYSALGAIGGGYHGFTRNPGTSEYFTELGLRTINVAAGTFVGLGAGAIAGGVEALVRYILRDSLNKEHYLKIRAMPSVLGQAVSLPFDAISSVSDCINNYVGRIKQRIEFNKQKADEPSDSEARREK